MSLVAASLFEPFIEFRHLRFIGWGSRCLIKKDLHQGRHVGAVLEVLGVPQP